MLLICYPTIIPDLYGPPIILQIKRIYNGAWISNIFLYCHRNLDTIIYFDKNFSLRSLTKVCFRMLLDNNSVVCNRTAVISREEALLWPPSLSIVYNNLYPIICPRTLRIKGIEL